MQRFEEPHVTHELQFTVWSPMAYNKVTISEEAKFFTFSMAIFFRQRTSAMWNFSVCFTTTQPQVIKYKKGILFSPNPDY